VAFAYVGSAGTEGTGSIAGTTIVLTTTATIEAGNLAVLLIGFDNTGTGNGDLNEITGVADSTGSNTWVEGKENTYGQGAAAAGVTSAIWYCRLTSQLTVGGTITVTLANSTADRVMVVEEFTVGANVTQAAAAQVTGTTTANAYGSLTFSGLSSTHRLYIRSAAREANFANTTALTPSTSFNVTTPERSRNNAAAITIRGEYRINTSTGETSNPSISNNAQDSSSVFIALQESAGATITSTSAAVVPSATASGAAERQIDTASAATTPKATASGTAKRSGNTTGAAIVPSASAAGVAVRAGDTTGAAIAPSASASGVAERVIPSSAAAVVPKATAAGEAEVTAPGVVTSTGAATVPAATASGAAERQVVTEGAATSPAAVASGTAEREIVTSAAATVPAATADGESEIVAPGTVTSTGAAVVPSAQAAGTATRAMDTTGAATAPAASASGSAEMPATGPVPVGKPKDKRKRGPSRAKLEWEEKEARRLAAFDPPPVVVEVTPKAKPKPKVIVLGPLPEPELDPIEMDNDFLMFAARMLH
jgi:hypothetical protein